jgi:hypothetical protein
MLRGIAERGRSYAVYLFPNSVIKCLFIYSIWIAMHYFAAHLYVKVCAPITLWGFIISPFLISAPHCEALRWIVYNGAIRIQTMWILLGGYALSYIEVNRWV